MENKEKQKEFIYFPSLSAGGFASALIKDQKLSSGVPCRFYSDEYPKEWQHKYQSQAITQKRYLDWI